MEIALLFSRFSVNFFQKTLIFNEKRPWVPLSCPACFRELHPEKKEDQKKPLCYSSIKREVNNYEKRILL